MNHIFRMHPSHPHNSSFSDLKNPIFNIFIQWRKGKHSGCLFTLRCFLDCCCSCYREFETLNVLNVLLLREAKFTRTVAEFYEVDKEQAIKLANGAASTFYDTF